MKKTKTVKQELFVSAFKSDHSNDFTIEIDSFDYDRTDQGTWIALGSQMVEVEVPDIDRKAFTEIEIEQLQERIKKEEADSYMRKQVFNDRIQSLLSIEHVKSSDHE